MPIDRAALRAGFATLALLAAMALGLPDRVVSLRESVLDMGLAATAPQPSGEVIVVAIDAQALDQFGRWPWPRARLARVLGQIAAAKPAVIGLDLVLSGPDPAGPKALADVPGGAALPDGDAALALTLSQRPTVLAAALTDHATPIPSLAPLLVSGPPVAATPWSANGLEAPESLAAAGLGVTSLRGEDAGRIRRVPLLVLGGQAVAPGFAAEVLRLSQTASALRLGQGGLGLGAIALPLGPFADLRIRPTDPAQSSKRTLTLSETLTGDHDFSAKIVLVGLTAPQAAALRPTAVTPLAPSVQIQADAIETMQSATLLLRPFWAAGAETAATLGLALLVLLAAARLAPIPALLTTASLATLWAASATTLWLRHGTAIDPATPTLITLLTGLTATAAAMLAARRRAAALRRRFERHLSPAVVARIAAQPGLTRLPGEAREVTALFTDIEGFSARAETLPPAALIAVLDRYFAGLTQIIHAHGGMIEKFVGDAAHVLFNAPFDLPNHPAQAIACAQTLQAYGEHFAADPLNRGLGRTRIGLECGPVIVGDVGAGEKLDYTAHGRAMNLAARLEQSGKALGTTLVAGPALHAALPNLPWQRLGPVDLRGFGAVAVYTLTADQR